MIESTRSLRPRSSTRPDFEPRRSSTVPTSSSAPSPATVRMTRSPPGRRHRDHDEPGFHQLAQPRGDELEQLGQLDLRDERVDDLVQGLELGQPAGRRFVQPGVLDGDGGLGREHLRQLLVLLGERPSTGLLRQVEVPVGDAAEENGHSEEGLHRRVIGREPDRVRILAEVVEPKRPRIRYEQAEDAAPAREIADRSLRLGVDSGDDESLELLAGRIDDAERRVFRFGQLGRRLDDLLQHAVQGELPGERDACVEQRPKTIRLLGHGGIIVQLTTSTISTRSGMACSAAAFTPSPKVGKTWCIAARSSTVRVEAQRKREALDDVAGVRGDDVEPEQPPRAGLVEDLVQPALLLLVRRALDVLDVVDASLVLDSLLSRLLLGQPDPGQLGLREDRRRQDGVVRRGRHRLRTCRRSRSGPGTGRSG